MSSDLANLDAILRQLQQEGDQETWLEGMGELTSEIAHLIHPLQEASSEKIHELKNYFLGFLQAEFFKKIVDHPQIMTTAKALLKLSLKLPEITLEIKKEVLQALHRYGSYLALDPRLHKAQIIEINELISVNGHLYGSIRWSS